MSEIIQTVVNSVVPLWLWVLSLVILFIMAPVAICLFLVKQAERWYPNEQPRKPRDPDRQRFYDQIYKASGGIPILQKDDSSRE